MSRFRQQQKDKSSTYWAMHPEAVICLLYVDGLWIVVVIYVMDCVDVTKWLLQVRVLLLGVKVDATLGPWMWTLSICLSEFSSGLTSWLSANQAVCYPPEHCVCVCVGESVCVPSNFLSSCFAESVTDHSKQIGPGLLQSWGRCVHWIRRWLETIPHEILSFFFSLLNDFHTN